MGIAELMLMVGDAAEAAFNVISPALGYIFCGMLGCLVGIFIMGLLQMARWRQEDQDMQDYIDAHEKADELLARGMRR